ncbi:hypothetical protein HII28_05220 [Planctomonas sp. JC2975]|uniref:hypothetical protein n=1 Tax=Planctomonas sp. JC2975 TaxID=2729626 RepID=UPI001474F68F|nr:hypothetical protein [Planctomonas sp. JC2975]NNC11279.1 hypothetical protein [Planctomonas sp. JC2975]
MNSAMREQDGTGAVPWASVARSFSGFCFVGAPVLFAGYGLLRIVDGMADGHGPGFWWTASHSLFLASLLLFGVVLVGLCRRVSGRWMRRTAVVVTIAAGAGLVATIRTTVIDLIVGFTATSRADMSKLFDAFGSALIPVPEIVSDLAPAMCFAGITTLLLFLALPRSGVAPWWAPLLSLGTALGQTSPWLAPVGALTLLAALLPVRERVQPPWPASDGSERRRRLAARSRG